MVVTNRKEIEDLVYKVFDALDPSGMNTAKYKKILTAMSEEQFAKWLKGFLEDDNEQFCYDLVEFQTKLDYSNAEKAAEVLGIPLLEYLYLPHLTRDKNNIICTKEKCLVGYLNIKRTQQMVQKKNGLSMGGEQRSALTGQVINDDKNSKSSDLEGSLMIGLGMDNLVKELYGPRGDDLTMDRQMQKQIETRGYVTLGDMDTDLTNKVTLNTINAYLYAMGLYSDLVTDTYILPKTSKEVFQ